MSHCPLSHVFLFFCPSWGFLFFFVVGLWVFFALASVMQMDKNGESTKKCLVYLSLRYNCTNARKFMDCQSMQCPVLISTLLCPPLTFLCSLWLDWCWLLPQQGIVRLIFSFKVFNICVCVVHNQLITCCQRARSVDCVSKISLAEILWVKKDCREQWRIKMNKAIAVWPVSSVEQPLIQKVSPLTTMEMWRVKSSLPLKMRDSLRSLNIHFFIGLYLYKGFWLSVSVSLLQVKWQSQWTVFC